MTQVPMIEQAVATGEVADLYGDIQRDMGIPFLSHRPEPRTRRCRVLVS